MHLPSAPAGRPAWARCLAAERRTACGRRSRLEPNRSAESVAVDPCVGLRRPPSVHVNVTLLQFSVTAQTICRDANLLCELSLSRRLRGGIHLPPVAENMACAQPRTLNHDAKRRIARCVARFVPDEASLFFGIGTTPEQCAHALMQKQHQRVMTNNLTAALALSRDPSCELTIAGGRLRNLDRDVVAGEAHGFFRGSAVDIGIYGVGAVGGVGDDGSPLDFGHVEARMRSELVSHRRQRSLVVDRSKFGRGATVKSGHITDAAIAFAGSEKFRPPYANGCCRPAFGSSSPRPLVSLSHLPTGRCRRRADGHAGLCGCHPPQHRGLDERAAIDQHDDLRRGDADPVFAQRISQQHGVVRPFGRRHVQARPDLTCKRLGQPLRGGDWLRQWRSSRDHDQRGEGRPPRVGSTHFPCRPEPGAGNQPDDAARVAAETCSTRPSWAAALDM